MSSSSLNTRRRRRGLLLTPALALTLLVTTPGIEASLASPSPTSTAQAGSQTQAGSETEPTTPESYKPPTDEELAAKRAEVKAIADEVTDRQAAMDAARDHLSRLQDDLEAAHEAEDEAKAAAETARAEEEAQQARLKAATTLVETRRDEAGQWASRTYRDGSLGNVERMMTLLDSRNTDDMAQRMQMLNLVGRWRGSEVDTVEEARAVQADATERANAAADAATAANTQAEAARASAEAALAEQTTQMMLVQTLLSQSQMRQSLAEADAQVMYNQLLEAQAAAARAAQAAAAAAAASAPDGSNRIVTAVDPNCPGGDISGFSNGQMPTSLLCPLWGNGNHRLRADAAKAYNDMSAAYAAHFGAPICITDSYRTYESQVRVKAAKPHLAARPGTSNHGWARAVDLCGGIQSFGSPQHQWMRENAPRFGWCHPAWARQNGSKPEAWHWEYLTCPAG